MEVEYEYSTRPGTKVIGSNHKSQPVNNLPVPCSSNPDISTTEAEEKFKKSKVVREANERKMPATLYLIYRVRESY